MYLLAKYTLIKVRFITLVNLLAVDDPFDLAAGSYDPQAADADQIPFPEYPSYGDESQRIAGHLITWLGDAGQFAQRVALLAALRRELGHSGASHTAARYILETLSAPSIDIRRAA